MRTIDFSPIYRSSVGFDRLPSLLDAAVQRDNNTSSYPPYNIELVQDDHYRITMAVAGFVQDELSIQTEKQILTISGNKPRNGNNTQFLHRGIASRDFERKFQLADYVTVTRARLENGLLHIELVRELPEAIKPRRIAIVSGDSEAIDVSKAEAA